MPAKPHEWGFKLLGKSVKAQVDLSRPYIVKTYNKYMEGIAKLDMMCALYKPSLESRRWFIYLWLHSIMITVVNVRILYCRHQKALGIRRHYQAQIASSLAAAGKPRRERPSSEGPVPAKKRRESTGRPTKDIQKDHVDHMPSWEEKRQRCFLCKKRAFSFVKFTKCNVFLCFNKHRNCFSEYYM